jgi:hypothetical protein
MLEDKKLEARSQRLEPITEG